MQVEFLCLLATFVYVSLVGWGILSVCRLPGVNRLSLALLGPILGFVFIESTLFAGYLYLGPMRAWAHAYAAIVGILAVAFIIRRYSKDRRDLTPQVISVRSGLATLLFGFIAFGVVALPALENGIQYAVFRSSGSDTFVYASMADNFRLNPLHDLLAAGQGQNEMAVVDEHPGALLTARLFERYMQAGSFITQGFIAEVFGLVSHRIGHLLACLGLVITGLAAASLLISARVHRVLACAAGFFISANPFARFMVEMDATAQVLSLGTFLAFIFFWAMGREQIGISYKSAFLAGLCASALCITYLSLLPILAVGAIIDILLTRKRGVLFFHFATGIVVVLLLSISGQIGWVVSSFLSTVQGVSSGVVDGYPAIMLFLKPFPKLVAAHIFGIFSPLPYINPAIDIGEKMIQFILGGGFALLAGGALFLSLFRRKHSGVIYVVSVCVLSIGLFVLSSILKQNDFILGKLIITSQPLLCIAAFGMLNSLVEWGQSIRPHLKPALMRVVSVAVVVWPITMLPVWSDTSMPRSSPLGYAGSKRSNFDFSAIHSFLMERHGVSLGVAVSDRDDWRLVYAVNAEMQRYSPTYFSGYVCDNQEGTAKFRSEQPSKKTDFLLTAPFQVASLSHTDWKPVVLGESVVLLEYIGAK